MIRLKPGVSLEDMVPQLVVAMQVVEGVLESHGADCVVASMEEPQLSTTSAQPSAEPAPSLVTTRQN